MSIEAKDLTVKVNRNTILVNQVSLTIRPGEIFAVVGPNGAGKSTLLRAITGDIKVDSGSVWMDGQPLEQWKLRERAKVRAVLSQTSVLSFAFTVLEVVLMGRGPHLNGSAETKRDYAIAYEALAAAEVEHLAERYFTTLSGGEKQRVQLARVLAQIWETPPNNGNRYLFMDEPTNNLDLTHQHRALQIARQLANQQVGVLVILHDLNLAAQYADRIMIMHRGEEVITGNPCQVLTPQYIEPVFNIPIIVTQHPTLNRPLIVSTA
ncbi:MAG: heme ABC transporter ATP-binding protein [Phototrophicales bacterium]